MICHKAPPESILKSDKGQSPARVTQSTWPEMTCNWISQTWQELKLLEHFPEEHQCNCTQLLFIYSFKLPTAFNLLLKSVSHLDSPERLHQIFLPPPFSRALRAAMFAWRNTSIRRPGWGNGVQSSAYSPLNSSHCSALCHGLCNKIEIIILCYLGA